MEDSEETDDNVEAELQGFLDKAPISSEQSEIETDESEVLMEDVSDCSDGQELFELDQPAHLRTFLSPVSFNMLELERRRALGQEGNEYMEEEFEKELKLPKEVEDFKYGYYREILRLKKAKDAIQKSLAKKKVEKLQNLIDKNKSLKKRINREQNEKLLRLKKEQNEALMDQTSKLIQFISDQKYALNKLKYESQKYLDDQERLFEFQRKEIESQERKTIAKYEKRIKNIETYLLDILNQARNGETSRGSVNRISRDINTPTAPGGRRTRKTRRKKSANRILRDNARAAAHQAALRTTAAAAAAGGKSQQEEEAGQGTTAAARSQPASFKEEEETQETLETRLVVGLERQKLSSLIQVG